MKKIVQKLPLSCRLLLKRIYIVSCRVWPPFRKEARQVIKMLRPYVLGHKLIRLGGDADGGYLVPDDLDGIKYCFSPGVDDVANFEIDLERLGIQSYLADFSVDQPPPGLSSANFIKKFVGSTDTEATIEINRWIESCIGDDSGDLVMQMDIEGGEYECIEALTIENLKRFRIIVLEVHILTYATIADALTQGGIRRLSRLASKITNEFSVCHIHPNNCCGYYPEMRDFPKIFEITFLRNDRVKHKNPVTNLPHMLDRDNVDLPSLLLPEVWLKD